MKPASTKTTAAGPSWTRRRFLAGTTAAAGAFTLLPSRLLGADSPSKQVTLAGIGIGGVGNGQLQELAKAGFKIVALCDVDDAYGKKTYDLWPQARRYRDFRELLAAEGNKVDAVYCGTPDHTHALITLAALKAGKHVCCVKPLTRTLHELQVIATAARKAGTATQVTASPNTSEAACRTCEIIGAGLLGEVRELHTWTNRPVWPQGMERPPGEDAIPPGLDWKLWLGPATVRPFKSEWPPKSYPLTQMNLKGWDPQVHAVYHPFNFRGWWDFGTGALGDMGCHHFNTPFRALKLSAPTQIQASASKLFPEAAPLAAVVTYDFAARPGFGPLRAFWYDGGLKPPAPRTAAQPWDDEGTLYIGEKGMLLATWDGIKLFPETLEKQAAGIPKTLARGEGTWKEWFIACTGGAPAGCNFDLAWPLTEIVLLGNLAIRTGKRIDWDPARHALVNGGGAEALVNESYQNGWKLE